jgi:hypothetical protein
MAHLKTGIIGLAYLFFFIISAGFVFTQDDLKYQKRENRFEGTREEPVAGYDIELISALVNHRDEANAMPDTLKIRFYLSEKNKTFLTVREINNKFFYWMNGDQPDRWQRGFNDFQWPTTQVLRKLADSDKRYPQGITDMYELGVVARVNRETPAIEEQVAPVLFYYKQIPPAVNGYLFTFKPSRFARITCVVYKGDSDEALDSANFPAATGDTPFTFKLDSSPLEDGWYRLVVSGIFPQTNKKFNKIVKFYHHRNMN